MTNNLSASHSQFNRKNLSDGLKIPTTETELVNQNPHSISTNFKTSCFFFPWTFDP